MVELFISNLAYLPANQGFVQHGWWIGRVLEKRLFKFLASKAYDGISLFFVGVVWDTQEHHDALVIVHSRFQPQLLFLGDSYFFEFLRLVYDPDIVWAFWLTRK